MPDDDKSDKSKTPRTPNVKDNAPDPADAFARTKPAEIAASMEIPIKTSEPFANTGSEKSGGKKGKKKSGDKAREPIIEETPPDDEGMDPADAAEEILEFFDGLFTMAAAIRGYDAIGIQTKDGVKPAVEVIQAKQTKARPRANRAIVRYMKTVGLDVSPGLGVGIALFGLYVAPVAGLEMGLILAKRQQAKQGG